MNQCATSVPNHCPTQARAGVAIDASLNPSMYARMFPELPSFQADEQFLHALGRGGGLCDCGDVDDSPSSLGDTAAGWPIFGQFVAHDITADRSILRSHTQTAELRNARSPQLNLECLYGDGPTGHPFLYRRDDPAKFLLGLDEADLQRNSEGIAIISDPRNDSHMLMSQLHLAMLKAHNAFVDEARLAGVANDRVFEEAARQMRCHYQWIVLNEFLPTLVGRSLADEVLREGPQWFRSSHGAFIPLEFADAAYRYGHSQIRHRYQLNLHSDPIPLFPDLLGFREVPRQRTVDWRLFFDAPGSTSAQRSKKIDGKLVRALIKLPVAVTGECEIEDYHSLAVRDLQRGQGVGLPSGEAVARHIGIAPLNAEQVGLAPMGWRGETPLWYYVLREADVCTGGHRLGPVGGLIVAEVLIALIDADATSFRRSHEEWRPRKRLTELLAP
ncbi:peroxidase [Alloacidobacterium dinghuense]|uniref:Peroxidase n=1 Tax=Alloacidobacterium dinghuense TaxID=2763107 RepID=A0A7G8BJV9_9BACT|nr:peroxidase family protein [Alloacidobacterium dinghuense]QNI32829.1 peroxidase [Alloacidobacterium dinghuense]